MPTHESRVESDSSLKGSSSFELNSIWSKFPLTKLREQQEAYELVVVVRTCREGEWRRLAKQIYKASVSRQVSKGHPWRIPHDQIEDVLTTNLYASIDAGWCSEICVSDSKWKVVSAYRDWRKTWSIRMYEYVRVRLRRIQIRWILLYKKLYKLWTTHYIIGLKL